MEITKAKKMGALPTVNHGLGTLQNKVTMDQERPCGQENDDFFFYVLNMKS